MTCVLAADILLRSKLYTAVFFNIEQSFSDFHRNIDVNGRKTWNFDDIFSGNFV